MSDEVFDPRIKVNLKGDGAAPWITVDGDDAAQTLGLLEEVRNSGLIQAVAETNALLTGAVTATNGFGAAASQAAAGGPPSPGPQQGAQAAAPAYPAYQQPAVLPPPGYQPPQAPPQYQPQAQPQSFNGTPHPEGLHCGKCGAPVIGKQIRSGSKLWTCPNQKSKGDGHYTKWLDD